MDMTTMMSPERATPMPTPTPTITSVTTPEIFQPLFVYGARALSLDAALLDSDPTDEQEQGRRHYRARLGCPNGNSSSTTRTPEEQDADDQCARANLFPAEMYASAGSDIYEDIFGGTFTPTAAPAKTWRCTVSGEYPTTTPFPRDLNGNCSLWESAAGTGASAVTTTESLDWCAVLRQKSPARLTAGRAGGYNEVEGANYYWDPSNYNSLVAADLSSWGCPDPTSLVNFAAAAAAATTTMDSSGTGTAGSTAGPTAASTSVASRAERVGSAALICVFLACAGGAGLLPLPLW